MGWSFTFRNTEIPIPVISIGTMFLLGWMATARLGSSRVHITIIGILFLFHIMHHTWFRFRSCWFSTFPAGIYMIRGKTCWKYEKSIVITCLQSNNSYCTCGKTHDEKEAQSILHPAGVWTEKILKMSWFYLNRDECLNWYPTLPLYIGTLPSCFHVANNEPESLCIH